MTNTSKKLGIYLLALALFIIPSTVMRTIACISHLNAVSGYFDEKIIITIADWFAVAGVVFSLSYMAAQRQKIKFAASFNNAATYIPSGLVSVALIFLSASLVFDTLSSFGSYLSLTVIIRSGEITTLLLALVMLGSIGAFLLKGLFPEKELAIRGAFDMVFIIAMALYTAYIYFDNSTPINSPAKIVDEMAFLFTAVFFLFETRISLGREKWRPYIAFGLAAAVATAYSSIPAIITYFARGIEVSGSIAQSVLTFTLFVFILARLVLILTLPEDKKCDTVNTIMHMVSERERIKNEANARACENNINEEIVAEETDNADNYTFNIEEIDPNPVEDTVREDG